MLQRNFTKPGNSIAPTLPVLPVKYIAADYVSAVSGLLQRIDLDRLEGIVQRLQAARDRCATIYVAGNGGSSAIASHWVNDLGKATKRSGRKPLRVMSLSDSVAWMTALANDEGYERIFSGQLENFATPGDLLIVISASGNSPNLVQAVQYAKARRVGTVGLLGFDGGLLKDQVDDYLWLRSELGQYELVEDAYAVLCHIMTICLAEDQAINSSALRSRFQDP